MYRIVNVPHANNKRAELQASVEDQTVYVRAVDPKGESPYNSSSVCDMFIGDHMFEPEKREGLRLMVGKAIITAIENAREVGYRR